jgi:hypothetical protein
MKWLSVFAGRPVRVDRNGRDAIFGRYLDLQDFAIQPLVGKVIVIE